MAEELRIHPLDLESDVAIGIDLPLIGRTGSTFKLNYTTIDQAVANAKNLLLTNRGERVMLPTFGCSISDTLFENITQDTISDLQQRIQDSFDYWLPYIFINELNITANEDLNKMYIKITISLETNKFDTRSIELVVANNQ